MNTLERTVIGIKPDAFEPDAERERGSELKLALPKEPQDFIMEVRQLLADKALEIIQEHTTICSEELARKHYAEFAEVYDDNFGENKQDFLARMMSSGPSHWLLCEGEDAVTRGREVVKFVREKYLETPKNARYNMTHGSGNVEEAEVEVKLHFGK